MSRIRRITVLLATTAVAVAVLAPNALAFNDGRGFYGETNDLVITKVGFMLIIFFPLFIFVMSMLQGYLERRKDARKAAAKHRLANGDWHGGW
jgi:hypothetical protein